MEVTEVEKPPLQKSTDAIIKIVLACVCGSDLWCYRGISKRQANSLVGHDAIGLVADFVIVPFTHGCGHCAACKAVFDGN